MRSSAAGRAAEGHQQWLTLSVDFVSVLPSTDLHECTNSACVHTASNSNHISDRPQLSNRTRAPRRLQRFVKFSAPSYRCVPMAAVEAATEQLASATVAEGDAVAQVVTPWDVQSGACGIDYDKLLTTFGCQSIDANLIARCVPLRLQDLTPATSMRPQQI